MSQQFHSYLYYSADSKGIQVWVELTIDMETMSRSASLDHLVEDERIFSVKSQECTENQGNHGISLISHFLYHENFLNGKCR